MAYEKDGKTLYEVGDVIDFEFQTYPGPDDHSVKAKVVHCYSETYYRIEFEFQGKVEIQNILRSHLR